MRAISALPAASFCEGVEAGHSSHGQQAAIAQALGITNASVKMDSQAKYATVARGVADIYLRLPTSATYQEKIWVCLFFFSFFFLAPWVLCCGGGLTGGMNRTTQPAHSSSKRPAAS